MEITMKTTKIKLLCLIFFPLGLLLNYLFTLYPYESETIYSLKINKIFIQNLSHMTSIFPFSLFEILLYVIIISIPLYIIITFRKSLKHTQTWSALLGHFILNSSALLSIFFFCFILFWGLNYNRPALKISNGPNISKHSQAELAQLYSYLITEANLLREETEEDSAGLMRLSSHYRDVFKRASIGYDEVSKLFPDLGGTYGTPKPILASNLMNYTGITGIYSPFTGEANVNVSILDMFIPSTTTHEMAHQRGYAYEDECNFIAFLTCISHPDIDFKYSGYMLALAYTSSTLAENNLLLLKELNQELSPKVRADIQAHNAFWDDYEGGIEVLSSAINDTYLKANGVADGEESYGRMVDLLLDYYVVHIK